MVVDGCRLRHIADAALDLVGLVDDVIAGDRRAPAGRLEEPDQHLDRRALAGAIWPEKAENLAGLDVEIQPIDGDDGAEVLRELLGVNHQAGIVYAARSAGRYLTFARAFLRSAQ